MLSYFRFILYGICFIAPAEYIIQTMIVPNGSFFGTTIIYSILLSIYYMLQRKSFEIPLSKTRKIIEFLILGSFGLFIMEWMIIGNSPWGNPEALQLSMFIWWVWVFLFPKVLLSEPYKPLRKGLILYHVLFSLFYWIFMIILKNPLAFIPVYAYGLLFFYYFLFRYIYFR